MNNPNPFVPKGSLLEQQSQRRSRLKLAVFCVLAVCVTGLVAMLIQGCKREKPDTDTELNPPPLDFTSNSAPPDANYPLPNEVSNPPVELPPLVTNPPIVPPPIEQPVVPVAPVANSEYIVVQGDTLGKIAKRNGVSVKALEAANPGVVPTKLKIGQKLVIPVGGKSAADAVAPAAGETGAASYTVKSGDTLTKIARAHHTTVKAIEAANNLISTKIKVGQKLKIPSKAEAAPAPPVDTAPAPTLPPPPISAPAPATTAPASGQ
jgi:LysM repeat protein